MKRYIFVLFALLLIGADGFNQNTANAASPKYPTKAINLIVPWNPGGGADLAARGIASVAPKYLGKSLIVVQKPGASGATAHAELGRMKKDGYNLIITGNSSVTVVPYLGKVNYDPLNDFEYIIRITNLRNCMAVAADSPINTIEDLIEHARINPGKIKIGTSGVYGIGDLTVRRFNKLLGIETVQVPFQSAGEVAVAVLGGHVAMASGSVTSVAPMARNKTMKILAITADERDPSFPDIRTLKERNINLGLNNQIGIGAAKGTPEDILEFLHGAFKQSMEDTGFKALANKLEFSVDYLNRTDFKKSIISDSEQIKAILAK
jgi:tripartite-type tricarboxylate transporter receptor subunit TctC